MASQRPLHHTNVSGAANELDIADHALFANSTTTDRRLESHSRRSAGHMLITPHRAIGSNVGQFGPPANDQIDGPFRLGGRCYT